MKQNPFLSAIWPALMLAGALLVGIKFHASVLAWIFFFLVFIGGVKILITQYKFDEETLLPHSVLACGTIILWIWAAS